MRNIQYNERVVYNRRSFLDEINRIFQEMPWIAIKKKTKNGAIAASNLVPEKAFVVIASVTIYKCANCLPAVSRMSLRAPMIVPSNGLPSSSRRGKYNHEMVVTVWKEEFICYSKNFHDNRLSHC